jgi:branched-chain amino acid transport system ATP-binding protein
MKHLLAVEGVSKNFGGLYALQHVSLTLDSGERRAVIGPNGAGKTTLFNVICGIERPSSGRIYLSGRDVSRMACHRRATFGVTRTFQITDLFLNLTVEKNVLLALAAHQRINFVVHRPLTSYGHLFRETRQLLANWDLTDKKEILVSNLSHGEQRVLELVLALAGKPRILLIDEPTSGLSHAETQQVMETLRNLSSDVAILLIEHDMNVAFSVADNITVLHRGGVVAEGPAQDIKADPKVAAIYLNIEQ